MTIVSSEVTINRPEGSVFYRRIREKHYDHINPLPHIRSKNYTFITDPADYLDDIAYQAALAAEYAPILAQNAVFLQEQLANEETQQWIQQMSLGNDPWHIGHDGDTWFTNSVPEFNDWNTASSKSLRHWLAFDNRQELLNCNLSVTRTGNTDLTTLLVLAGSTFTRTDLRSEIQIAVDTQVGLDTYIPSVEV